MTTKDLFLEYAGLTDEMCEYIDSLCDRFGVSCDCNAIGEAYMSVTDDITKWSHFLIGGIYKKIIDKVYSEYGDSVLGLFEYKLDGRHSVLLFDGVVVSDMDSLRVEIKKKFFNHK